MKSFAFKLLFLILVVGLIFIYAGCSGRIVTTRSNTTSRFPETIAVYPMLTSIPKYTAVRYTLHGYSGYEVSSGPSGTLSTSQSHSTDSNIGHSKVVPFSYHSDESNVYISPPSEFTLAITLQSQMMTDALYSQLSQYGFALKQLPIVIPEESDDSNGQESTFAVTIELLNHLKEHLGLEAILIGNVLFEPNSDQLGDPRINRAYFKLIDIETLDVICLVSVNLSGDMEDVVADVAAELSRYKE